MHRGFFMALLLPSLLVCASNLFEESHVAAVPNGCMERIEIKNSYTRATCKFKPLQTANFFS